MKRNTYLSERTLGKGTRFKSESQEKVINNQPQREPARRNPRREIWCTYGRTEGYATHMGPDIRSCRSSKIINEAFGNSEIREEETPEALNFLCKVLEDVTKEEKEDIIYLPSYIKVPVSPGPRNHLGSVWCKGNFEKTRVVHLLDIKFTATTYRSKKSAWNPETCLVKPRKRKPLITKTFESYYIPEVLIEDNDESSMNKEKDLKQEEVELSLEAVLGSFVDAYYKILKNWIPELEDTKTEYESGNLPKGNDKKKRRSPADEASEELVNTNESAEEIRIEKEEHKASKGCEGPTEANVDNVAENFFDITDLTDSLDNLDRKNMPDINDPKDQNDSYYKTDKRDNKDNNDSNDI
ncbi:hypothetical protein C2G38_2046130 [Gigaspora rosea]|uniref:Uncharacterized protein n=1 Tax=Gigaspora rosea TaxID=44941 RepID=A0A397UAE6_9GLOM|nr:hypothetical protein C2G38_2046130 [Gigaspora rosea]